MKHFTVYAFFACCYFLVLLEVPCIFFGQHVTYFAISPSNCKQTVNLRDPNNLYLTLYAGACKEEFPSISFLNIFNPESVNGCIDPLSKNWTAIDLANKKYGKYTNLQKGGQDIMSAYYVSVAAFIINIFICVAVFGLQFKRWVKVTCLVMGFLILVAFILSISSFYMISNTDQVLPTSWSTDYFKNCDVKITTGLAYTLNLTIVIISGILASIPILIRLFIWIAPQSIPVVQPNNSVGSEFNLWEIFPDAGRCSLDIVNVYRDENSPIRPAQRQQAVPLRGASQEAERPHQSVFDLVESSLQMEEETLNDASFSTLFGDDYRTIKKVLGDKDTTIEQPLHTMNNSGMKENQSLIRRNSYGEVSILSSHPVIQSFPSSGSFDFGMSQYFESFSDVAFSRSAHFVGLLQPPGRLPSNNNNINNNNGSYYWNTGDNYSTGEEYPAMHYNDLFPVHDDWIFDNNM